MDTFAAQAAELAALPVTPPYHAASRRYAASRLRDGALAIIELAAAVLAAYGGKGQVAHDCLLAGARDLMQQWAMLTVKESTP